MKRIGHVLILLTAVCTLSGCGSSKVELTDEQNSMVAEYIAGALLRYDMRYEEKLQYIPEEVETEAAVPETQAPPVETELPQDSTETLGQEPSYKNLNEVIGIDGMELTYKRSAFYDSYPKEKNDFFILEPGVSNKLLVAEFELSNTTGKKQKVDLSGAGIKYSLKLGGREYKPLLTALPNDLRYLSITVAAEKSEKVIIIFEVEKDKELKDAEMMIDREGVTAQIKPL